MFIIVLFLIVKYLEQPQCAIYDTALKCSVIKHDLENSS